LDPEPSESDILTAKLKEITRNTKGTIPVLMFARYLRGRELAETCKTVEEVSTY